jgi:O-antigen/teichoic acid export membrane protein
MTVSLLKNGAASLFIRGAGTLIAFFLSIYIARLVGAEGFGVYSFVLSGLMILSVPIQAGLPVLAVRECAKTSPEKQSDLIIAMLLFGFKYIVIYSVFISLIIVICNFLVGFNELKWKLLASMLLIIPVLATVQFLSGILRGGGQVILGVLPDGILRQGFQLTLLSTLSLLGVTLGTLIISLLSYALALVFVLSFVIFVVYRYYFFGKDSNLNNAKKLCLTKAREWNASLMTLTVIGGVHILLANVDLFLLGVFSTEVAVAEYRVAMQFSLIISFGLTAINQVLQPYLAQISSEKGSEKLQDTAAWSSLVLFMIAVVPSIILLIYGEVLIQASFGLEYTGAAVLLNILILGQLFNTGIGSVGMILNMYGYEAITMKILVISVVVNIILDVLLIPMFGSVGAAISALITVIFWNLVLRIYVRKNMKIESSGILYAFKKLRN